MTGFNTKIGAGLLAGLGLIYMISSLATGRSARAEAPPDLDGYEFFTEMKIWQAAYYLVQGQGRTKVIDLRSEKEFARYHIPGSYNKPGADTDSIAELAKKGRIFLVAAKDEQATKMAAILRSSSGLKNIHYIKGGVRTWYLTFELPVPLFSDKEAPFEYEKALAIVRAHFSDNGASNKGGDMKQVSEAIRTLAGLGYEPTLLKKTGKSKSSNKKRKKIAGGCG
ncbi:MAG: rhodanese-like domain-containing protein [Proteobacteria bacterium]|nr:rhodanese-like domain-containing protein [Pseudomonadota bacterium]